jgi:hypothetical protein
MGTNDFNSDLGLLSPTTSVGPADGHSAPPESEARKRRRAHLESQPAIDDLAPEPGDIRHEFDDLA